MTKGQKRQKNQQTQTANEAQVARFSALAATWWNAHGPMRPLHKLNPVRLAFIKETIAAHCGARKNITVLDMGCGGGLVSEPLAQDGFDVTGLDASAELIEAAKLHAQELKTPPTYRHATATDLLKEKKQFDVVLALEIIEHVDSPDIFLREVTALVKKDGVLILSTLNRTPQSFALGIVGAEYILRWLPIGTHDWKKFVKPSELAAGLQNNGFAVQTVTGLCYNPLTDQFSINARDVAVNYFMVGLRA